MSGMRDFVTGSDMCTPSDGAGPSNAVGALVNQLLGGASKTQEQLRDLPAHQRPLQVPHHVAATPEAAAAAAAAGMGSMQIPGLPQSSMGPGMVDAFLHGPPQHDAMASMVSEFEQFSRAQPHQQVPPHLQQQQQQPGPHGFAAMQPPPPSALAHHLRAFMDSTRSRSHFAAGPLPDLGLSLADQCRIRDRSTILARQLYADVPGGEMAADSQVGHLLASLHINPAQLPADLSHVHDEQWHSIWNTSAHPPEPSAAADLAAAAGPANWDRLWQGQQQGQHQEIPRPPSTGWADEFAHAHPPAAANAPQAWAQEFSTSAPQVWAEGFTSSQADGWATEFAEAADSAAAAAPAERVAANEGEVMAQTKRLVDVLSGDADPKMRNSKFLQFLSKMSKGELGFEGNAVVERQPGDAWAQEFGQQGPGPGAWADEFGQQQRQQQQQQQQQLPGVAVNGGAWADEFGQQQQQQQRQNGGVAPDWADEFAKGVADLQLGDDEDALNAAWAEVGGAAGAWVHEFDENGVSTSAADESAAQRQWDAIYERHASGAAASGRGEYVFAADNPFLGDAAALDKGKDLFRRGLLSEAALALEAEVQAHPDNADAWRLLGTVHAENDDDRQAIAAMDRALKADPTNLDVLLSLGVSHTNELDSGEAITYLSRWLHSHPQHRATAEMAGPPNDSSQVHSHTIRTFQAAAAASPQDAELQMALGVLHHLSRQHDGAVRSFQRALELRPQDYSLWNKLGATLANFSHSKDALGAYRKALDLKPNYMRAWTNMGISYANVGDYEASARYYVRALALNPRASHVWGYLRTSLACAGRSDLMGAVDGEDLAHLQTVMAL